MEGLAAAVQAAASGAGVVTPELLGGLLPLPSTTAMRAAGHARPRAAGPVADRGGHPDREVAQQLCYSERTVENVLHDVVTKLNARSSRP